MHTPQEFFGADLSRERCEALAIEKIDRRLLKEERALKDMRWFDYRWLHPVKATYLFAHHYSNAYRLMSERRFDAERAPYVKGFKGKDIFTVKSPTYLGFWRARQMADRHCIPYDFYTRTAMMWAIETAKWPNAPRPHQLYSGELAEKVVATWDEEMRRAIRLPASPFYRVENYAGHPIQDSFQEWLAAQIKTRANPERALMTYLYYVPMLRLAVAEKHFDVVTLGRAADLRVQ